MCSPPGLRQGGWRSEALVARGLGGISLHGLRSSQEWRGHCSELNREPVQNADSRALPPRESMSGVVCVCEPARLTRALGG